jgi:exonuclease III
MNALFWNIKKKDTFTDTIVNIVREEDVDLIAFAEFPAQQQTFFEQELKRAYADYKYLAPIKPNKIELFYRDNKVVVSNAYDGKRINVNKVHSTTDGKDYNLIFCHLKDAYSSDRSQLSGFARPIVKEILDYEDMEHSKRTLICGDFNMDPFESGMLEYDGFNAMQTESLAKKRHRNIEGESYQMFYNPTWGLMGDLHGKDVPGTYYYAPSHPIQQYWHLLDQVIMRPDVIPVFDKSQLKIVTKGQTYNLLNKNNNIDDKRFSDHLPIKFHLNI